MLQPPAGAATDEADDEVVLEVRDLQTHFVTRRGTVRSVDGVSFTLKRGKTLGILGESGSGKSVTALSLLRLVPKPAGRIVGGAIFLNGEDLLRKSEAEMRKVRGRRISMIMQDPMTSLNPVFTIGDQVIEALALNPHGDKRSFWEQAVEMLQKVRISAPEARMKEYQHQLSGGMRQRVVGAMALSCRPDVLIADEPTTSLDLTVQAQYLALLRELQRETGVAIIVITHDFGIVADMCDHVLVMYAGRVVESASLEQLFANPSHPYTRALMECVPPIDRKPDRLTSIEGQPPNPLALPQGCRFHPRCPVRMDRCQREAPPDFEVAEGHVANCWRLEPGAAND